ncbi:MAG TPA: Na+/H+ antiporter subunit E [Arachnia sp.]|nr:Na+/H+ antiporter subunit E [Arachnia sp.]
MRLVELWAYLATMFHEIARGSGRVARSAWLGVPSTPAILEMPLRCRSDMEISLFTASIAMPPGTIVVGIAGGRGDDSTTIFVHSVYDNDRERVMAELEEMEGRVIDLFRGRKR